MNQVLQKGIVWSGELYQNFKKNYFLKGIDRMVDMFLDESTKDVIKKYQSNIRASAKEESQPVNDNMKIKIIGIKLFLIYQKAIKTALRIKDRITHDCQLIVTSLGNAFQDFKNFFIVQKTSVCIAMVWHFNVETTKLIIKKLQNLGIQVRFHPVTKRLLVYANDVKQLTRITFQVIYEFACSTVQLKRSRALYSKVMSKYNTLKSDYKSIKQQSQILSCRIKSERGDNDLQIPQAESTKKQQKCMRNMKSQDNLYEKRKLSIKINDGQILEQCQDRSQNLQMSKLQESDEDDQTLLNLQTSSKRIDSPGYKSKSSQQNGSQPYLSFQSASQDYPANTEQTEDQTIVDPSV